MNTEPTYESMLDSLAAGNGRWERFENPSKGPTITYFAGNVPLLSIHNNLLAGELLGSEGVKDWGRRIRDPQFAVRLLILVGDLNLRLKVAMDTIMELTGSENG